MGAMYSTAIALTLDKEATRDLLEWNTERLLYVRLNSRFTKLSIIVVFAPTKDEEEFCGSLQETMKRSQNTTCS